MLVMFVYHLFTIRMRMIPGYEGFQATEKGTKLLNKTTLYYPVSLQRFHLVVHSTALKMIWETRLLWTKLAFPCQENFVVTLNCG